jgi:hypothetical protein
MPRLVILAAVFAAAALAGVAGAGAAGAPLPSPGSLLLAPSDFGRYAKATDATTTASGLTTHVRSFHNGLVANKQPLLFAASLAIVLPDASTTAEAYQEVEVAAHTPSGRRALAKEFGTGFATQLGKGGKSKLRLTSTTVGTPRFETDTVVLPIVLKTNLGTIRMPIVLTHVDRVIGGLVLVSYSGHTVPNAAVDFETAVMRKHLVDAFTVANTAVPTIGGSAAQGQTLTVDEGTWSGAPSSYTYAWLRCSSGTCTPVDGATGKSYVVAAADSGSTLQVAVTGVNSVGSATASSVQTAVVQ